MALIVSRPTTNAPKPNTRFLRNIIKETDSHNAALRAKEAQDTNSRLQRLRTEQFDRPKTNKRPKEVEEADHQSKRRRLDRRPDIDGESNPESRHHRESKRRHDHKKDTRSHRYHTDSLRPDEEQDDPRRRHRHRNRHHSHRSRSRSLSGEKDVREYHRRSSKSKRRSAPPEEDRNHAHKRRRRRERSTSSSAPDAEIHPETDENGSRKDKKSARRKDRNEENVAKYDQSQPSDSDPLESLVGPLPPPPPAKIQSRGRGKFASSSAMDSHFSSTYDPSQDLHPNSGSENDWDQALEALRDRQRWKQQGAERLRLAGFTEEEVGNWEKGAEKRNEDVRWNAKGEGREWDRGKVVGEDEIETRAEWGRLKGT